MTTVTGYYSLIQYCPDPSRLEAANVGVLLFVPSLNYLRAITAKGNRRIQQFFGRDGHDWTRINTFKRGMEDRVQAERPSIRTVDDLERFIAKRANALRITDPRPMRVTDPEADLKQLFAELVGGVHRAEPRQSIKAYLHKRLVDAGLQQRIRNDIRIRVPSFEREVTIPYGYQNGRFQLIQPARFEAEDPDKIIPTACRYAVEGRSLYEHQDPKLGRLQLVVVGVFPAKKAASRSMVRRIFDENKVRLFASDEVDRLIQDIRQNAKELPAENR